MELDTGSVVSLMSSSTFRSHFPDIQLLIDEFEEFLRKHGIHHITYALYHPSSNGLAERAVQIVKNGLKRDTNGLIIERLNCILFNYRITPHSTTGISPVELLFGRTLKSKLDLVKPDITRHVQEKQRQQHVYHDQHLHDRSFSAGENVYYKNFTGNPLWLPGTIKDTIGNVNYAIKATDGGTVVRRHIDHIRFHSSTSVENDNFDPLIFPEVRTEQAQERIRPQDNIRFPYPTCLRHPPDRYAPLVY